VRCSQNELVEQISRVAGKEIQNQELERFEATFHGETEEIEEPHVSDDVEQAPVQEHAGRHMKEIEVAPFEAPIVDDRFFYFKAV